MSRRIRMKKLSARKGISLTEVVVALAVISIISAAALSLVISSANIEADVVRTMNVSAAADDVLDCFRYADNNEEFEATIQKLDGYQTTGDGQYVLNKPNYVIVIKINGNNLSFEAVKCKDGEKGESIYSYEYTKGISYELNE